MGLKLRARGVPGGLRARLGVEVRGWGWVLGVRARDQAPGGGGGIRVCARAGVRVRVRVGLRVGLRLKVSSSWCVWLG